MANPASLFALSGRSASRSKTGAPKNSNKIALLIAGVMLLAVVYGNGCAGVVASAPNAAASGGNGTPPPVTQPALSANPMSASFPNVSAGSSSSQTITLTNAGTANVTISQAAVAGSGFSTTGLTVPLTIEPGKNAAFNAVFTPGGGGNASGSIALTSNAPNSPLTIAMSGTGLASTYVLSASAASLGFGDVLLGGSSVSSVTLTNSGNANVTISGMTLTGTEFGVTGVAANTTLAPGQTAVISVSFLPTVAGSASGGVTVNSNANPVMVSFLGNGVQPSTHSVALAWDPSTSDVVGYFVYRGAPQSGIFVKLNSAPLINVQFMDTNVGSGQTYGYVVTAVDADNVESIYSDEVDATVP